MRMAKSFLLSLLFAFSFAVPAAAMDSQTVQAIPVQIFKSTIKIQKGVNRNDLKTALSAVISDFPSVDIPSRLQYDVQLIADAAPVTFVFDFDRKGVIKHITIDAHMKSQNPAVTTLLAWLETHAGKPSMKKKGRIVWKNFAGWKIEHVEQGSGEDSTYRTEMTAQR